MIQRLKSLIENGLNCRIYRDSLPYGTDLFIDLDKAFGLEHFRTVFDIGANMGQSALTYLDRFPMANIYSFEPVASTYTKLAALAETRPRIHPFRCGMGKQQCNVPINLNPDSGVNSILHSRAGNHTEIIVVNTVTGFCEENHIDQIDFMKIDTEGYELEVLEGSRSLLERQNIRIIFAECEPIAKSNYNVPLPVLAEFLDPFGYELIGIYEQSPYYWAGKRSIRFSNAAFVCRDLVALNGRHL